MACLTRENNRRVLIVDDEEDVLEFLRIFLGSLGWDVTAAGTPEEGLDALEARAYFLALTDIAMPDMDGYELCQLLRERDFLCEVALMTGFGYNPKHTLVKIRKSMQPYFFFKPFNRIKVSEGVQLAWTTYHRALLRDSSARLSGQVSGVVF